jgi:hypothetical protein
MGRKTIRGGYDKDLYEAIDDEWGKPIVMFGVFCLGLFILSIVVWTVFNYSKVKINNIWISLLIAIPITLLLNEIVVKNSAWRTADQGGKSFRLGSIPVTLFAPLNIFGMTGFSRIYLWTPFYWTQNVYVIWWLIFLGLSYIRK